MNFPLKHNLLPEQTTRFARMIIQNITFNDSFRFHQLNPQLRGKTLSL